MAKKKTSRPPKAHEQILHLRISLLETEPLVWRRVLVPGFFTLEALHSIFQISMGWQMSHLYDFEIGDQRFAEPGEFDDSPVESVATSILAALRDEKKFFYNYDFGDSWRHEIVVEDVTGRNQTMTYPLCTSGENACPPEDCGGPPGFEDLKDKIRNSKNPEYPETMAWLGGFFDPRSFDPNRINRDMLWTIDWRAEPNDQGLYVPFSGLKDAEQGLHLV